MQGKKTDIMAREGKTGGGKEGTGRKEGLNKQQVTEIKILILTKNTKNIF